MNQGRIFGGIAFHGDVIQIRMFYSLFLLYCCLIFVYALLDSSIGVFKKLLERRQYCRHFLVKLKDAVGNSCENIVKNGTV